MSLQPSIAVGIDGASTIPPYEQIRAQIAGGIADGSIVIGTRLPTVRALAAQLGVAVNTVARSYRELEASGLVQTAGRAGTVVAATGDASHERLRHAARDYAALARSVGVGEDEASRIIGAALAAAH